MAAPVGGADVVHAAKFEGWKGPKPAKTPCLCRARDGKKLQLGETTCVKRGGGLVTLQCRLVLNNTSWEKVDDGCVVS